MTKPQGNDRETDDFQPTPMGSDDFVGGVEIEEDALVVELSEQKLVLEIKEEISQLTGMRGRMMGLMVILHDEGTSDQNRLSIDATTKIQSAIALLEELETKLKISD